MSDAAQDPKRRLVDLLAAYWLVLRGDRQLPALGATEERQVPDMWPRSLVIDTRDPDGYKVTFCGDKVIDWLGFDATNQPLNDCFTAEELADIHEFYDMAITERLPVVDNGGYRSTRGKIRFRRIAMPFGDNGTKVDCLVVTHTQARPG